LQTSARQAFAHHPFDLGALGMAVEEVVQLLVDLLLLAVLAQQSSPWCLKTPKREREQQLFQPTSMASSDA